MESLFFLQDLTRAAQTKINIRMYLILRFVLGIIIQYYYGRLAQLVEHLLDVQRVSGSSPLTSTTMTG